MTSRDRLMAAFNHQDTDHIPMAFMIFSALKEKLISANLKFNPVRYVEDQIDLGLDAFVDLRYFNPDSGVTGHSDAPGIPVLFDTSVRTRQWASLDDNQRYPVLFKNYDTPSGTLSVSLDQTNDWPYGDARTGEFQVPFMDDYLAARCHKFLVEKRKDLESLEHLLIPPSEKVIQESRTNWERGTKLAKKHDLLVCGGWGVGSDALAWFCGLQNAVYMAIEDPEFFRELLSIIEQWNRARMEVFLDYGVDLFIRRAWYEGTDFWSPEIFREFFYPVLKEEVRLVHQAGSKYGYIMTSGSMLLHEQLVELGIDVLIGPDPVQGNGTDLLQMGKDLKNRICTWGGVNGFITVERGTDEEIEQAVEKAIKALGPEGFILSPVDNIRDPSEEVWDKVLKLIEYWKHYR